MKTVNRMLKLAVAALLFSTIIQPSFAAPPHTGIRGQAMLHIIYPSVEVAPGVWTGGTTVDLPVATSFTVTSAHSGRKVGRFSTDADGAFEVSLPPGKYVVVPDPLPLPSGGSVPTSIFEVTVKPQQFTPVVIDYYALSISPATFSP